MKESKKIAAERGFYDPNRKVGGGDRMIVKKCATGGNNLNIEHVVTKKITTLKITDEGEMVTYEPQKAGDKPSIKLVIGVNYEGQATDDPQKWAMNNKSRNALIDLWGDDTKSWINKSAEISIAGEGEFKHIIVDALRTK